MSDEQDASPTRAGQAVQPTQFVMFGIAPDGQFILSCEPDDEMIARALAAKGVAELDRYYTNKTMQQMLAKARENRVISGMVGTEDARRLDQKMRRLK